MLPRVLVNFWWLIGRADSIWYPSLKLYRQSKLDDWEDEFTSGKWDMQMSDLDKPGKVEMTEGPEHTYQVDKEGMQKYRDRVENGYRLFGKYYDHLWE